MFAPFRPTRSFRGLISMVAAAALSSAADAPRYSLEGVLSVSGKTSFRVRDAHTGLADWLELNRPGVLGEVQGFDPVAEQAIFMPPQGAPLGLTLAKGGVGALTQWRSSPIDWSTVPSELQLKPVTEWTPAEQEAYASPPNKRS